MFNSTYKNHYTCCFHLLVIVLKCYFSELVDCFDPPSITNGVITYNKTYYTFKAHYRCNLPYLLIGKPSITCQKNGLWEDEGKCGE